jgi:hypothetical protein
MTALPAAQNRPRSSGADGNGSKAGKVNGRGARETLGSFSANRKPGLRHSSLSRPRSQRPCATNCSANWPALALRRRPQPGATRDPRKKYAHDPGPAAARGSDANVEIGTNARRVRADGTGTNFTGTSAIKFGTAAAASFTVNGDTSITATAPAGRGAGRRRCDGEWVYGGTNLATRAVSTAGAGRPASGPRRTTASAIFRDVHGIAARGDSRRYGQPPRQRSSIGCREDHTGCIWHRSYPGRTS